MRRRLTSQEETNFEFGTAASTLNDVTRKAAKCTDKREMAFISEQQVPHAVFFLLHDGNNALAVKSKHKDNTWNDWYKLSVFLLTSTCIINMSSKEKPSTGSFISFKRT